MTDLGLLSLDPILVAKPWGGVRLASLGKEPPADRVAGTRYGESWEVADLPADAVSAAERGRTRVAAGPHRGKTLRRLIADQGSALVGSASPTASGDFPLLFKLLDTAEHLSIQVHPDQTWTEPGTPGGCPRPSPGTCSTRSREPPSSRVSGPEWTWRRFGPQPEHLPWPVSCAGSQCGGETSTTSRPGPSTPSAPA